LGFRGGVAHGEKKEEVRCGLEVIGSDTMKEEE
jgi:hypothetical protein